MAATQDTSAVIALLTEQASAHGLELVHVEFGGQAHAPLVRVYLDREGGIDIDAISAANSWVMEVLDARPGYAAGYTLEVSSPGIDRPLVKPADFERFAGSEAKITTAEKVDGRSHFTGTLAGLDGDDVLIGVDGTTHRVPHALIRTARLRAVIELPKEGS
jgi:ribosome maturation factor RimP